MVLTTLGRTAARAGALGVRAAFKAPSAAVRPIAPFGVGAVRFGSSEYDWNLGVPGSRIKNPAPDVYDDVYPGMGNAWWALIIISTGSWFWGNLYDLGRPVNIAIGLFGPNLPL
uniref:Uncharacterized protein n=1 Tax=Zooxanthella nutricula TaxID=1333877 RepID=A0A7S2NA33_9DINO